MRDTRYRRVGTRSSAVFLRTHVHIYTRGGIHDHAIGSEERVYACVPIVYTSLHARLDRQRNRPSSMPRELPSRLLSCAIFRRGFAVRRLGSLT